jgi:hypothetical protein
MQSEISEGDHEALVALTGDRIVPDDVVAEYLTRKQMASSLGFAGDLPWHVMVDLIRYLGYKPKAKKKKLNEQVRWEKVPLGTVVIFQSPEQPFPVVGWYAGGQSGTLEIQTPHRPDPWEVYARYTRIADDDDDTSSIDEFPNPFKEDRKSLMQRDEETEEKRKSKRRNTIPKPLKGDRAETDFERDDTPQSIDDLVPEVTESVEEEDDEEEMVYPWSDVHIGFKVLAEDGEVEFSGEIVRTDENGVYIDGGYVNEDGTLRDEQVKMFRRKFVYDNSDEDVKVVAKT